MKLQEAIINVDMSKVEHKLKEFVKKVNGKNFHTTKLCTMFNNLMKNFNITMISSYSNQFSAISMYSNFYIQKASTTSAGNIEIIVNDEFCELFGSEDAEYFEESKFIAALSSIISHELIHRQQLSRMKNPINVLNSMKSKMSYENLESEYFSNKQEMMAFSKNVVDEWTDSGYSKNEIINKIKHITNQNVYPDIKESDILWNYHSYFPITSGNVNKEPLKSLFTYMIQYAQKLQESNLFEVVNKNVTYRAQLVKQTDKAYCFDFGRSVWSYRTNGLERDLIWLPKSITRWDSKHQEVTMPKWLAEKRKVDPEKSR